MLGHLRFVRHFAILLIPGLAMAACADADRIEPPVQSAVQHTVSFVGYVYDGASGERIDGYTIDYQTRDVPTAGTVDDDGRYALGDFSVWEDYTVIITAEGYRTFLSHNGMVGLPPGMAQSDDIAELSSHQNLHYDAYLFPTDLQSPAGQLTIKTGIPGETPSGMIRLRPASASILADEGTETPGGVTGQVWTNDEDLQGDILTSDFANGSFTLQAGDLIYGVTYQVDIYNVTGYQPFDGTYTTGVETSKTFTLTEELAAPLEVVSSTASSCQPPATPTATSGAVVALEFNHPIELGESGYPGGGAEALDDGLVMVSPDDDEDTLQNVLQDDVSDSTQERGVTIFIAGSTLTISWNPSIGLQTSDIHDPITSVTHNGLANVVVRRINAPSSEQTLAALVGATSITCN
ncbi:MAG: hypothetical protein DRI90_23540 [Deltaproteobacteria bacterium]|nr:MAG: hypothetical protein DRI90_23540 [Deltaproteobacteria bacterium]